MDINFNYSITNVTDENVNNLMGTITSIFELVKEANLDSYKNGELRTKVSELESQNKSLRREIEDLKFDKKLEEEFKPAKKAAKKASMNFNEVDDE